MDRYFIDYRREEVVKNLDTSYLAPEMFLEIVVDDNLEGCRRYLWQDAAGRQFGLMIPADIAKRPDLYIMFKESKMEAAGFIPEVMLDKILYVSQEWFNKTYQGVGN